MTFSLPKKTLALWQLRIVFAIALLFVTVLFFCHYITWFLLPSAIVAAVGLFFTLVYVLFYFRSYKISVNDGFISISKGVIIKSTNIMPYPRLVFAQSFATPLSSVMKLKCIMLKAARGWMLIPEIENADADYLLDNLMVKPND